MGAITIPMSEVLRRHELGQSVPQIAADLGCSHVAVYKRLVAEYPEEWRAAQTARALADLDKAQVELEAARDVVSVARAREMLKSAQWRLERVCNRIYGPQQHVTIDGGQNWSALLDQIGARHFTVEGQSTVIAGDDAAAIPKSVGLGAEGT